MRQGDVVDVGYRKAVELLQRNASPEGFVASSGTAHYDSIWTRDAAITAIGANLTGVDSLLAASRNTLVTLSRLQAPLGQIPNVHWPRRCSWDWGEAGCTDAAALFIIAAWHYHKVTNDRGFIETVWPSVRKAFTWLRCQDANNFGLVDSPEAGDWMDSTLNRCGKVFYVNVLYYRASMAVSELAKSLGDDELADPEAVKFKLNLLFWPSSESEYAQLLGHVEYPTGTDVTFPHPASVAAFRDASKSRRFYLSHVAYAHFVDKCDVFANLLAILYDVADSQRKEAILEYLAEKKVSSPYPVKCWPEPETPDVNEWGMFKTRAERYQESQWHNPPHHYHNGGIWPFIGGFYVLALHRSGDRAVAEDELRRLAESNELGIEQEWGFHEWLHGESGEPMGASYQSWNAGAYVMAYKAVREGFVVI